MAIQQFHFNDRLKPVAIQQFHFNDRLKPVAIQLSISMTDIFIQCFELPPALAEGQIRLNGKIGFSQNSMNLIEFY